MPIEALLPKIDDRQFPDIMDEIKARVARYAPEWQPVWNDFNYSDPGIILSQTVAWLSEMMIYRMNQIPELNYLKFLEMLGAELRAAQPATVAVTFPVKEDATVPYVDVPIRTQVSAAADEGGPPIVYETSRPLRALTAQLLSVQSFDGAAHAEHKPDSDALAGFQPFGPLAGAGAALVLGLGFPAAYPTPDQFPPIVFELAVYATAASGAGSFVTCGLAATGIYAPAKIVWEGWNGTSWAPVDMLKDETAGFTRSGAVVLRTPAAGVLKRDYLGAYPKPLTGSDPPPLFWLRARLVKAQYETPPSLVTIATNTVPALQAQTVENEVLGGTDGTRNQSWSFASTPVIEGSLVVQIDEGTGAQTWAVRSDLLDAGPQDEVLALDPGSGTLTGGDGVHGAVAVANPSNPDANVIALQYRYGGGLRGNVAAGAVSALPSTVDGIDGGKLRNIFPASGGSDEERLDDAKERARRLIRSQCRAVTNEDFEALAKQAGNIARAKSLPLFHPQFPTIQFPGAVSVIIVPNAARQDGVPFTPLPSDGLMRTVCAYLDARRLLTTEVYVLAPSYQSISVTADVIAGDDADSVAVRQAVETELASYFDPIVGGDLGNGWGFGETIYYSKVYQRIFSVDGVDAVQSLLITLDGADQLKCEDVAIKPNGLLVSVDNEVTVLFADEVAA